MIENTLKA